MELLNNFLSNISNKNIDLIKLPPKLQDIIQQISNNKDIIFILDIEFQSKPFENTKHILEMGGIFFIKKNNIWFSHSNFHINLPLIDKLDKLNIIQSKYITAQSKTKKQIEKLEDKYLFINKLNKAIDNPKLFKKIYSKVLLSPLTKKKKFIKYDPIPENFKKIIRNLEQIAFTLKSKDIDEDIFNNIWNLYLNDTVVKHRTINLSSNFANILKNVIMNSTLIMKGNMDLIAINNLLTKYKIPTLNNIEFYDIAKFNESFKNLCDSAKLEESYWCLINKSLVEPDFEETLKKIFKSLVIPEKKLIAHNPLIDCFYTLVVGITMFNKK